jgi:beta-glucanase (GH16 family)
MMPQDSKYGIWPKSGEIDITEYQSIWRKKFKPDVPRTPGSLHFSKFHGDTAQSFWTKGNDPSQWHIYSMIWKVNKVEFLFDGCVYGSYSPPTTKDPEEWPFNQPFYLIINLAVGPGFGTQPANSTNTMHLDVDWIRVTKL